MNGCRNCEMGGHPAAVDLKSRLVPLKACRGCGKVARYVGYAISPECGECESERVSRDAEEGE